MMKKMFLLFYIYSCFCITEAMAIECPKVPAPKLTFSMKKYQTNFDFSKSVQELTNSNLSSQSKDSGWVNEGIMTSKFPNYTLKANIHSVTYPAKRKACYWIDEVDFSWIMEPTINVAREYKRGSCKYRTIISHERQHVEIDLLILSKYKEYIRNNLKAQTSSPIATGLIDVNKQVNLLSRVEKKLKPLIDKMVNERQIRQGRIDTVKNYEELANRCKHEK
jgi:hypothetical protein